MGKGSPIMKHGNFYNHFDFRMFRLTEDNTAIVWTKKSTMKQIRIEIRKIHEIVEGQQTKTFRKSPKPEVEDLSFSIRYKYNKGGKMYVTTLDLFTCRKFDRELWVRGLRALMETPGLESLSLNDGEDSKDDKDLAGEPLLHRSGAATATRYTGAVATGVTTSLIVPPIGILIVAP